MKTTFIILIATILFTNVFHLGTTQSDAHVALPVTASLPDTYRALLPEGYEVPANLPTTINDPLLLTAWVYIYNQQEQFEIHDGIRLSGRQLANLVIDHNIPVVWGTENNCGGSSCAKRTLCSDQDCVAKYQRNDWDPIYIAAEFQEPTQKVFPWLVKTLAHELYHQTLPFGPVGTSQYEEYWAFYVGTQVSKAGWMEFKAYNPLKAACLNRWFVVYGLDAYAGVGSYPFTLQTEVDLASKTCN